jgi:hypothetical protein
MLAPTNFRPATEADAHEGSALLGRSIAELCGDDHGFDAAALAEALSWCSPEITKIACRFYRSMGYEPVEVSGTDGSPMRKTIAAA